MSVAQRSAPRPPMPQELFQARAASRVLEPAAGARLIARMLGGRLDRALIEGADPAGSARLAARASQLSSARSRRELAGAIDALVRAAQGPQRRWWALASPSSVLANSAELHALASLLDSDTPVYARGVALARELLRDGTGPAYRGDATRLARAVSDARAAMRG